MPSNQKLYRITIMKSFQYPSCSVDESNFLSDLHHKAFHDFIGKAALRKIGMEDFTFKLESELPFSVKTSRNKPIEVETNEGVSVDFIIKEIVTHEFEKAYGTLDADKNPDIYDDIPELRSGDLIFRSASRELKPEYEQKWHDLYEYYNSIIRGKLL